MLTTDAMFLVEHIESDFPDLKVRLAFKAHDDDVPEIVSLIKEMGYTVNIESTAYGDVEIIVMDKKR